MASYRSALGADFDFVDITVPGADPPGENVIGSFFPARKMLRKHRVWANRFVLPRSNWDARGRQGVIHGSMHVG
jgi:hypothetical protein